MNLPPEVMAQWQQALANYGHPWKPGQQCFTEGQIGLRRVCTIHGKVGAHDIPMPAVTDELLWQMLVKGSEHEYRDWFLLKMLAGLVNHSLAAAVILAWASMEVK
jgi:hypothetical protein